MRRRTLTIMAGAVTSIAIAVIAWAHNVPTDPTEEDRMAIRAMLLPTLSDEVRHIQWIQKSVLEAFPTGRGIPIGQKREPADLIKFGEGLCYDLSRAIEKALEMHGFETRHVAVYESRLAMLLPDAGRSHALTEVLTSRGWMLVDNYSPWIGLTDDGDPISADELQERGFDSIEWAVGMPAPYGLIQKRFNYAYIFSRHGGFYPPYTSFVPDVNWGQFLHNFL